MEKTLYQMMPPLSEEEYEALKADIRERGVLVPVVFDAEGSIIDGHHRWRAVAELKDEGCEVPDYPVDVRDDKSDQEKKDLAWSLNLQRRHLDQEAKRTAIGTKLKETPDYSNRWISELVGVDHKTVSRVRVRLERRGEIPQVVKARGKDGKEYHRDVLKDYVAADEHQEKVRISKAKGEARTYFRQHPDADPKEVGARFGIDELTAKGERKMAHETSPTMGETFGLGVDHVPELEKTPEEEREELKEKMRCTRELKDEGYKNQKDFQRVVNAVENLAHALQVHRFLDKPKRYITPEEAAESYISKDIFKSSSLYYRKAITLSPEHEAVGGLTDEQRDLLEEINTFARVADWVQRFVELVNEKAQQDIGIARRALEAKDRIAQDVEEKNNKEKGSVTPLTAPRYRR